MKMPSFSLEKPAKTAANVGEGLFFGAVAAVFCNLVATGFDAVGDLAAGQTVNGNTLWNDFYRNPWISPEGVVQGSANWDLVKFLALALVAESYRKAK